MSAAERKLLVVAGPTASGKTSLALELAGRHPLRLISADSMQVYRGMDIGTSKPAPPERGLFGLIDVADPGEGYSAGRFAREAGALCQEAWAKCQVPCVVGGSGLYIRALLQGMAEVPAIPPALRAEISAMPEAARLDELLKLDPETAANTEIRNPRRVSRALEVVKATGKGLLAWQREGRVGTLAYGSCLGLWLNPSMEELAAAVSKRNRLAFAAGWPEEAKALAAKYGRDAVAGTGAIGYAELLNFKPDEAMPLIETATLQYAKRQRTWFKKDPQLKAATAGEAGQAAEYYIRE